MVPDSLLNRPGATVWTGLYYILIFVNLNLKKVAFDRMILPTEYFSSYQFVDLIGYQAKVTNKLSLVMKHKICQFKILLIEASFHDIDKNCVYKV